MGDSDIFLRVFTWLLSVCIRRVFPSRLALERRSSYSCRGMSVFPSCLALKRRSSYSCRGVSVFRAGTSENLLLLSFFLSHAPSIRC